MSPKQKIEVLSFFVDILVIFKSEHRRVNNNLINNESQKKIIKYFVVIIKSFNFDRLVKSYIVKPIG